MAPASKRRKVASSRVERPRGVAEQFRQADVSDVKEVSRMFEGKEFCVVNGPKKMTKQEIERKIAEVTTARQSHVGPCLLFECVIVIMPVSKHTNYVFPTHIMSQHGGTFVQNPGPDTFCVLVEKVIVRANNIIRYMAWPMI